MKRHYFLTPLFYCSFFLTANAVQPDQISGIWKSSSEDLIVKIDKVGNHFQGRIIWIESDGDHQFVLDEKNPVEHLAKMPLKGSKIIKELTFNPNELTWDGGTFYSYQDGKRYQCRVNLNNENQIQISKFLTDQQASKAEVWIRQ